MSYTVPPAAADPRPRPGIVTAASYLLYLTAAVQVVNAILGLTTLGAQRDAMTEAYADYPDLVKTAPTFAAIAVGGAALVAVLFAAGFVVLGILDGRGRNVARIITWVVGGLAACCFGGGLVARTTGSMIGGQRTANAPDPAEVQRIVNEHLPSWYGVVTGVLGVVTLLSVLLAVILLALPASNAYFRRPEPTMEAPGYPSTPTG